MRALVIAIAILIGGLAHADTLRTTAIGFDHMVHDRTIVVHGGESIACVKCHITTGGKLVGRPDHATCFGTCHGAPPVTPKPKAALVVPPERMKLCTNCHSEASLAAPFGKLPVAYPPYALDLDFTIVLGHKQHAAIVCSQCHVDPGASLAGGLGPGAKSTAPRVPHARCAGCHDGLASHGPPMSKCESCHQRAAGTPLPPKIVVAVLPIASTFSHKTHGDRSAAGKACSTCHAAISSTDDPKLPRPGVATCAIAGCHDNKRAFGVTASCTKCHRDPPKATFHIIRPTARFLHAKHDAKLACVSCHRVAANGDAVPGNHASCLGSGCHDAEFGMAAPTICGACHNTTEPWRALTTDRAPADTSEFGATLEHGKHATLACTDCHRLRTPARELRTPRGHASCTTAGCHAVTSGPAPHMAECETCHTRGLEATRDATRIAAPWTTRVKFAHTSTHQFAKDGTALACTACHDDLSSPTVLSLATPKKAACATCHSAGGGAFKVTGTGCAKCHGLTR